MYWRRYFRFSVVILFFSVVKCELFTALVQLQRVLQTEESLANDLRTFVASERAKLDTIERIADDYESHSAEAMKDVNQHLANPINAFLLVKRLTSDWSKVLSLIESQNNTESLRAAVQSKVDQFPDEKDLQGAGAALLRLQDTYALHTSEIVKGNIKGVSDSPSLSTDDCVELGKIAYFKEDFYHCVMWMTQALQLLEEETQPITNKVEILDYLSFALFKQGNLHHALNYTIEWLKLEPGHARALANKEFYESEIQKELERENATEIPPPELKNQRPRNSYQNSEMFHNYEKLCRGDETHKLYNAHKLYCTYKRDHPYFIISPVQMEIKSFRPMIYFFHNLVTKSEIAMVKEKAYPKLHRSGVFVWQGGNADLIQDYRTSKSAWLSDSDDRLIARISKKAEAVSGLTVSTAEELQVLNYGIGGHYEPHHDFVRSDEGYKFDTNAGNRIATVLFYMTDVKAGGATVFPQVGAKVFPKEGSCVMWYNLLKNGEGDYSTQHAACPVLAGTKWVCNKWFHERGQEFNRKCDLNPDI